MTAPNFNLRATSMRQTILPFWNILLNQSSDQHVFMSMYTKEAAVDNRVFAENEHNEQRTYACIHSQSNKI